MFEYYRLLRDDSRRQAQIESRTHDRALVCRVYGEHYRSCVHCADLLLVSFDSLSER